MSETFFKGSKYEATEVKPGVYKHVFTHPEAGVAEVVRMAKERQVSLTTACLACGASVHGEWHGEPPYTLVCGACGQSHTVIYEEKEP